MTQMNLQSSELRDHRRLLFRITTGTTGPRALTGVSTSTTMARRTTTNVFRTAVEAVEIGTEDTVEEDIKAAEGINLCDSTSGLLYAMQILEKDHGKAACVPGEPLVAEFSWPIARSATPISSEKVV